MIEMVGPKLHHSDALVPIFAACVGPTDAIALYVRELTFDRIGIILPGLVEQGRRHRPEAVRRHLLGPEAEGAQGGVDGIFGHRPSRSEEHTSELQSLMRISYAVFCLKKKKKQQ